MQALPGGILASLRRDFFRDMAACLTRTPGHCVACVSHTASPAAAISPERTPACQVLAPAIYNLRVRAPARSRASGPYQSIEIVVRQKGFEGNAGSKEDFVAGGLRCAKSRPD